MTSALCATTLRDFISRTMAASTACLRSLSTSSATFFLSSVGGRGTRMRRILSVNPSLNEKRSVSATTRGSPLLRRILYLAQDSECSVRIASWIGRRGEGGGSGKAAWGEARGGRKGGKVRQAPEWRQPPCGSRPASPAAPSARLGGDVDSRPDVPEPQLAGRVVEQQQRGGLKHGELQLDGLVRKPTRQRGAAHGVDPGQLAVLAAGLVELLGWEGRKREQERDRGREGERA